MSVAGKSVGDTTPVQAYQPVRVVDAAGSSQPGATVVHAVALEP